MSGWDWLHAGLEVATYTKAQKAQRDLNEMKTVTEIEAARRALIEAMRNFLFDISRDIQLAEEQLTEFPQQVYIVSSSLNLRLSGSGLSAEVFPDIQDKEYVFKTEKKISKVIDESIVNLTEQQVQESEKAIQYIFELPILQQAISAKAAQEYLVTTSEQWRKLSSHQSKKKLLTGLGVAGLVLSACVGFPLALVGLGMLGSGDFGGIISGLLMLAFGGAVPIGSITLLVFGSKSNPGYAPLKTNRDGWQKQLLSREDSQQVISTFGDLTSEQFRKTYKERLAFLNPLLGGDFQKYLAPKT